MSTFSDITLPLLFPDMRIKIKRFVYVKPFVKWVKDLYPVVRNFDLPLSDLEFKFAYPEAALELGRINEIEYKQIKKFNYGLQC